MTPSLGSIAHPTDYGDIALVLAFSELAAQRGWSAKTLRVFCKDRGIADEECRRRWPHGVRSLGLQLNAFADARTLAAFPDGAPLAEVLLRRFEDNEPLKAAVRALALSDLRRPLDTIRRTTATATLFWRLGKASRQNAVVDARFAVPLLVVLYSLAVLVWLADEPPAYRWLRAMVRFTAAVLERG